MKQTAVEWLYNKMLYIDNEYDMKLITKSEYQFKRRDIIEQAKEMEKERKIEFAEKYANSDAFYCSGEFDIEKGAEEYYNETIKSE